MADSATRLRSALLANSGVAAIVGPRVHQSRIPQSINKPYIWINRSGTIDDECLGASLGASPLEEQFDIECWSPSLEESQQMADAVRTALHNTRPGSWQSTTVAAIIVTDQTDDYLPQGGDDETQFYSSLNATISYQ